MSEPQDPGGEIGPGWRALAAIGIVLVLVAAVVWVDAQRLPPPPTVGVGPSAAMRLVAIVVAVLGAAHLVAAWRARGRASSANDAEPVHGNLA